VALGNALLSEWRTSDAEEAYARAYGATVKTLGRRSPAAQGTLYCRKLAEFLEADARREVTRFSRLPRTWRL
jgi:hypothetical protein